jgi:hypothetical protein
MTTLAARPVEDPDQLSLIADSWTTLGKPFADAFRDACEAEAHAHGFWGGVDHGGFGWVNPSAVRARVLDHESYEPRRYAALWSTGCARDGYMTKTDRPVAITGQGSRGNLNKSTFWRMWIS